jgi:predicted nuclease of predicted toxin-antitoxin system
MKFLADAGISPKTVAFLNAAGHDAVHVRQIGLQRASDADIVRRARQEGGVVLTFDLDFGQILALGVADSPSVVIFRLSDETSTSVKLEIGGGHHRTPRRIGAGRTDSGGGWPIPHAAAADLGQIIVNRLRIAEMAVLRVGTDQPWEASPDSRRALEGEAEPRR